MVIVFDPGLEDVDLVILLKKTPDSWLFFRCILPLCDFRQRYCFCSSSPNIVYSLRVQNKAVYYFISNKYISHTNETQQIGSYLKI